MKRLIPALALVALALTACGSPQQEPSSEPAPSLRPNTNVFQQSLPDGRSVTCIWARGYNSGGVSCDWENAK